MVNRMSFFPKYFKTFYCGKFQTRTKVERIMQ